MLMFAVDVPHARGKYGFDIATSFLKLYVSFLTVCVWFCGYCLILDTGRKRFESSSLGIRTMNFVVTLMHIHLAAVLHLSTVKTASINKGVEESNEVILLPVVITKSMCQPREILVDIFQEYPEDTEHTYIPSCVVLNRCGGCCNDEAMECVSIETRNVTLQVMRFRLQVSQHTVHLSFTEHHKCDCRQKPDVQAKKQYHCLPCSERRKRLFVQDPLTCKCSCKFTQLDCKSRQLSLNKRTCRCDKTGR